MDRKENCEQARDGKMLIEKSLRHSCSMQEVAEQEKEEGDSVIIIDY